MCLKRSSLAGAAFSWRPFSLPASLSGRTACLPRSSRKLPRKRHTETTSGRHCHHYDRVVRTGHSLFSFTRPRDVSMSIPSVGFQKKKEPRRSPRRSLLGGIRWTEAGSVSCFRGRLREFRGKAGSDGTRELTGANKGRPVATSWRSTSSSRGLSWRHAMTTTSRSWNS